MARLFGTDGVRGRANETLTPELAMRLGRAAGMTLAEGVDSPTFVIGRDTRVSGSMLESAVAAGLCSAGVDVWLCGVCTTPAVAFITRHHALAAGVVISASHNPPLENGIKFFGPDGSKLPTDIETRIETLVGAVKAGTVEKRRPERVGVCSDERSRMDAYREHCLNIADPRIRRLHCVVDGANGAGYALNSGILRRLGLQVAELHCGGDGERINDQCGSTHPASLQKAVVEHGADLGAAFDGDGDRVILVDEKGRVVDGDHVLAICGTRRANTDRLPGNTVVGTVMSNAGLEDCLSAASVRLERADVGDRSVAERMRETGAAVGGEKSGHIIFSRHGETGDGLVTALEVMGVMAESGRRLSELAGVMAEYPQVLLAVRVGSKDGWEEDTAIREAIKQGERDLKGFGRVLVRASGTEQVIRVMVEGRDESVVRTTADRIARKVAGRLDVRS